MEHWAACYRVGVFSFPCRGCNLSLRPKNEPGFISNCTSSWERTTLPVCPVSAVIFLNSINSWNSINVKCTRVTEHSADYVQCMDRFLDQYFSFSGCSHLAGATKGEICLSWMEPFHALTLFQTFQTEAQPNILLDFVLHLTHKSPSFHPRVRIWC